MNKSRDRPSLPPSLAHSPFAVGARARYGLDLKPEAPPLFSPVILGARLAVEGAGGPQLGQALVLVVGGDLEEREYVTLLLLGVFDLAVARLC